MRKLGSLMDSYLPHVIQLVTCIGGLCTSLLMQRERIHPKAINVVKNIRNAVIVRICQVCTEVIIIIKEIIADSLGNLTHNTLK